MTKHKQYAFKKRLMKKTAQNRRVPAWIMRRTNRNVVRNPKRRTWRRGHLHLG